MPMSRRAMFWRMVTSSILRRRSRVLIAILAVAIGATTLSGLVTIAVDVPAQMAREIRSYGANLASSSFPCEFKIGMISLDTNGKVTKMVAKMTPDRKSVV